MLNGGRVIEIGTYEAKREENANSKRLVGAFVFVNDFVLFNSFSVSDLSFGPFLLCCVVFSHHVFSSTSFIFFIVFFSFFFIF